MKYVVLMACVFSVLALNFSCTNKTERQALENKRDEYFSAVMNNDSEKIVRLVNEGMDVDIKNRYGNTALMEAVLQRKSEMVKLLLEKGADINAVDTSGTTVLVNAVRRMNLEIIEQLIDEYRKTPAAGDSGSKKEGDKKEMDDIYADIIGLVIKNYSDKKSVSIIEDIISSEIQRVAKTVYIREEPSEETIERIKDEIKQDMEKTRTTFYVREEVGADTIEKIKGDIKKEIISLTKTYYIREEVGADTIKKIKEELKQEIIADLIAKIEQYTIAQEEEKSGHKEQPLRLLLISEIIREWKKNKTE